MFPFCYSSQSERTHVICGRQLKTYVLSFKICLATFVVAQLRHLQTEIETWELVSKLYFDRLNPSENEMESDQLMECSDMYHINEINALYLTVGRNPVLKEVSI